MPTYITKSDLQAKIPSTQVLAEASLRKAESRSPQGSTFLSHSSNDQALLPGVVAILEEHGAQVYTDKKDDTLPPYTSRRTADLLRDRVRQCRKFILFTTKVSKDSRWMPWELGLADGYKGSANTAILPGTDRVGEKDWAEQEYLGIYNRIVFGSLQGYSKNVFMVWNQDTDRATELSKWLGR